MFIKNNPCIIVIYCPIVKMLSFKERPERQERGLSDRLMISTYHQNGIVNIDI